jgi:hypothetical protein
MRGAGRQEKPESQSQVAASLRLHLKTKLGTAAGRRSRGLAFPALVDYLRASIHTQALGRAGRHPAASVPVLLGGVACGGSTGRRTKKTWLFLNSLCASCSKRRPLRPPDAPLEPEDGKFIFGSRSNIHIIDLSQSIPLLHQALVKVREVAASGGRILFVGTKRQASEPIATAAKRCAQYYVNHRWLGGTLTNWRTVSGLDRPPARAGRPAGQRRPGPLEEGAAAAHPRARQARAVAWAASRTWAAFPT